MVLTILTRSALVLPRIAEATGFLYKMVRFMVGTLLDIGKGKYEPEYIMMLLEPSNNLKAVSAAPAKGLTLESIEYESSGNGAI